MQGHRRIELTVAAAALAAICFVGLGAQGSQQAADLVLRGGRVITLTPDDRVAEAIAVRGNQILFVGSDTEVRRFIVPKTRIV